MGRPSSSLSLLALGLCLSHWIWLRVHSNITRVFKHAIVLSFCHNCFPEN